MKRASKELRFEDAAAIRDRIKHLEALRDDTVPDADMSAPISGAARNLAAQPPTAPTRSPTLSPSARSAEGGGEKE